MRKLLIQELQHARARVAANEVSEARRHVAMALCLYESVPKGTLPVQVGNVIVWADRALASWQTTIAVRALNVGLQFLEE
jgi:hypothetical protein